MIEQVIAVIQLAVSEADEGTKRFACSGILIAGCEQCYRISLQRLGAEPEHKGHILRSRTGEQFVFQPDSLLRTIESKGDTIRSCPTAVVHQEVCAVRFIIDDISLSFIHGIIVG